MQIDELLQLKKLLDEGIISKEEFDKEKEALLSKRKRKSNKGLVIGIACVVVLCLMIIGSNGGNKNSDSISGAVPTEGVSKVPKEFSGEFPVSVSGRMYDNIIGMPELSLSFSNTTDQNISAIKIYFSPTDVYGEEVSGIFTTNQLYTDDTIAAGATVSKAWQMLDSSIKAGNVYVYSIYFEDGTEWGNKDAATSDIKKYGYKFNVKY